MNKIRNIMIIALLAFTVTACGTTTRMKSVTAPASLQINLDDLEYLGETEISVSYSTYLYLFSSVSTVNGEVYSKGNNSIVSINGLNDHFLTKAAYKLVENFPRADYYQVVYQEQVKYKLFLGNEVVSKARVRAYSFK